MFILIPKWIQNLFMRRWSMLAIAIWPFVFVRAKPISGRLIRHEKEHLRQWVRGLWIGFLVKYLYYHFKYGYEKNPYEIAAREAEEV